jgi:hypothetical protein
LQNIELSSWEAFEARLRDLLAERDRRRHVTTMHVSDLLFRGHSDSSWRVATTLERYTPHSMRAADYFRAIHAVKYISAT